jgi:hypothetical protein
MEIYFNGRTFNVVEYDKAVHGEITNWPSEFVKDLKEQDLVTQIKRFRISYNDYTKDVFYKESYNKIHSYSSYVTYKDYYFKVKDIIVKDGEIVAVTYEKGYGNPTTLQIFDPHFLFEAEDNNGAGYKTSDVYVTLLVK